MKYCPLCQVQYSDDSLQFCLEDGARLLIHTNEDWEVPTQVLDERETVVKLNRITNDWKQSQATRLSPSPDIAAKSNPIKVITTAAVVICLFFACSIGGWIFFSKITGKESDFSRATPAPTPKNVVSAWQTEENTDRPGGDYLDFDLSSPNIEICREACDKDENCQAFTYVKPDIQGDKARCWLKNIVPQPMTSTCCISGVKGTSTTATGGFSQIYSEARTEKSIRGYWK
jgi:hypothetical protein